MRKHLLTLFTLLTFFAPGILQDVSAQQPDIPAPVREAVLIDYFSSDMHIAPIYTELIRRGVAEGFLRRGRHKVIDAQMIPELRNTGTGLASFLYALIHGEEMEQRRSETIRSLNPRYGLTGMVVNCESKHETVSGGHRYTSAFVFVLIGYDFYSGESIGQEEFRVTGVADTRQDADRRALEQIAQKTVFFIDKYFKFETEILQVEAPSAKGKYKELYIRCGSAIGVQNGDLFKVYLVGNIGGVETTTLIGKVRAREIQGEEVTKCSISNGGEAIARAFADGKTLMVVSDGQALF